MGPRAAVSPAVDKGKWVRVTANGQRQRVNAFRSGDSAWAWIDCPPAANRLAVVAEPELPD